jgi:hypothetical protein
MNYDFQGPTWSTRVSHASPVTSPIKDGLAADQVI